MSATLLVVPAFLPFLGDIGVWEWVVIAVVAILLFGNRLPDLGRMLGKGMVSFRKGVSEMKDEIAKAATEPVKSAADITCDSGEDEAKVKVVLLNAANRKIEVIQAVREITGLGLKEATGLVDSAPVTLREGIAASEAGRVKDRLEAAGAAVEIKS